MTNSTPRSPYSSGYRRYVLLILTGVYAFNFIDRQILVILQESIKADLGISDTQLGLLTGFAFAIFYVSMGIPIARLADKYNRKNIVTVSLVVWSGITALSGLAQNYIQLLLARIGVGIGEAGGSPPAHAMLSDYYPPEKRATALSTYSVGIYIGILVGLFVGGILDEAYGWRVAFFAMGIPGILYAFLLYFTVKEPQRGFYDKPIAEKDATSMMDVSKYLFSKKTFIYLGMGSGLAAFSNYGVGNWMPSFLARTHGMTSGEIGLWLSLITGFGGGIGTYLGGYLADRYRKTDERWALWIPCVGILIGIPFSLGAFFLGSKVLALFLYFFATILSALYLGPSIASTHNMVAPHMRAFSSAILFFILNLIGLGLGPLYVGMVSDGLSATMGSDSVRWAMGTTPFFAVVASFCYWKAAQTIREDLI